MREKFLRCLFVLAIFTIAHCKKDSGSDNTYGLPNATRSGVGVMACRINGVNAIAWSKDHQCGAHVSGDKVQLAVRYGKDFLKRIIIGSISGVQVNQDYTLRYGIREIPFSYT